MDKPLFSIIMPTYNRASVIGSVIDAILSQSLQSFELIIVDDGSTDNTKQVLSSYDDSRIKILNQANNRQTQARRIACIEARGKYLAFCDSDDIWDIDYLSIINSVFSTYSADFVFTNYMVEGETKPRIDTFENDTNKWLTKNASQVTKDTYHFKDLYTALTEYQPIFCSCQALTREHYNKIGGISENVNNKMLKTTQTSEDSHIIRKSAITDKSYFINKVIVKLGRQGDNTSHSFTSNLSGGLKILLDLSNNYGLSTQHQLITQKAICRHRQILSEQIYYFESSSNYIAHYRLQPKLELSAKNHAHFIYSLIKRMLLTAKA